MTETLTGNLGSLASEESWSHVGDDDYQQDVNEAWRNHAAGINEEMREMMDEDEEERGKTELAYRLVQSSGLEYEQYFGVDLGVLTAVNDEECKLALRHLFPGMAVCTYAEAKTVKAALGGHYMKLDCVRRAADMNKVRADGACFRKLCARLGLECPNQAASFHDLLSLEVTKARGKGVTLAVWVDGDDLGSGRNHIALVEDDVSESKVAGLKKYEVPIIEATSRRCPWFYARFSAGESEKLPKEGSEQLGGFGSLAAAAGGKRSPPVQPSAVRPYAALPERAESVADESVSPGSVNVSSGVVRRARRGIAPRAGGKLGRPVVLRNYAVAAGVMFNNMDELVQDSISPEFAQEIVEQLFDSWGLPTSEPEAMKYAEDMLLTFLIAVTASDKADYDREFAVPTRSAGEISVGFKVLSDLLVSRYGVTRRQFARGMSDRLRAFAREDDNAELRANMAARAGCQPQLGYLAFDGSTHCKGLSPSEVAFTRTLESRNLFESDDALATGSSERLLNGVGGRRN